MHAPSNSNTIYAQDKDGAARDKDLELLGFTKGESARTIDTHARSYTYAVVQTYSHSALARVTVHPLYHVNALFDRILLH